jgi:hypothetical protein
VEHQIQQKKLVIVVYRSIPPVNPISFAIYILKNNSGKASSGFCLKIIILK